MFRQIIKDMLSNIEHCPNNKCGLCVESVEAARKALSQIKEEDEIDNEVINELRTAKKTLEDDKEKLYAIIRDQRLTIEGYKNRLCEEEEVENG